jgi:thiol-disulfide isomerase/thioredoxin
MRIGRTLAVAFLFLLGMRGFAGEGAAQLSLHDTQGNTQDISKYRGRIVVLNFWATWCVPCQHEMPLLAEMQKKYENKGVVVLGASVDDKKGQPLIQPFAEKNKIPFPLLVAATADQMQQLQLGEAILPPRSLMRMETSLPVYWANSTSQTSKNGSNGCWANATGKRLLPS